MNILCDFNLRSYSLFTWDFNEHLKKVGVEVEKKLARHRNNNVSSFFTSCICLINIQRFLTLFQVSMEGKNIRMFFSPNSITIQPTSINSSMRFSSRFHRRTSVWIFAQFARENSLPRRFLSMSSYAKKSVWVEERHSILQSSDSTVLNLSLSLRRQRHNRRWPKRDWHLREFHLQKR